MGSKAKKTVTKLFEVLDVPDRFVKILKGNKSLFACNQKANETNPPEINGYTYFGSGNRLFYYIKLDSE